MLLSIYIPPKMEEKCKIVIDHCRNSNVTLSNRVQRMINKIYAAEIKTSKEE